MLPGTGIEEAVGRRRGCLGVMELFRFWTVLVDMYMDMPSPGPPEVIYPV